jgi:hypothetical protein
VAAIGATDDVGTGAEVAAIGATDDVGTGAEVAALGAADDVGLGAEVAAPVAASDVGAGAEVAAPVAPDDVGIGWAATVMEADAAAVAVMASTSSRFALANLRCITLAVSRSSFTQDGCPRVAFPAAGLRLCLYYNGDIKKKGLVANVQEGRRGRAMG